MGKLQPTRQKRFLHVWNCQRKQKSEYYFLTCKRKKDMKFQFQGPQIKCLRTQPGSFFYLRLWLPSCLWPELRCSKGPFEMQSLKYLQCGPSQSPTPALGHHFSMAPRLGQPVFSIPAFLCPLSCSPPCGERSIIKASWVPTSANAWEISPLKLPKHPSPCQ